MTVRQEETGAKMQPIELMRERHSVRSYTDEPVSADARRAITEKVAQINAQTGLHIQAFFNEPDCFSSRVATYGLFKGVTNYLALVGPKAPDLDERCGYWGEELVLLLQSLGLGSCWVALTHGKSRAVVNAGEKLVILVAFGNGATAGAQHKSHAREKLVQVAGTAPDWFELGAEGALLAPTALNQQKFLVSWDGDKASLSLRGIGAYAKVDLGIVRHDFEAASGHKLAR